MFPKETKILIVDDMMTMRKLVRKTLADLGYTNVTESDDGERAWPEIEKALSLGAPFRLVISDWNMPRMSGIDLLKKVRGSEQMKDTPFILLTAESEKSQVMTAIESGVSGYITKPFAPATLAERLSVVWQNQNKTKA